MENQELITAEFYPMIPRTEIASKSTYRYSLTELAGLGSGFAVVAAEIAKAAQAATTEQGLYRCIFPEGVTGHLAAFKDGSGYLSTILDESGIAAQARFVPVEGASVAAAINPVVLAIAAAIMVINKKMDGIKETQEEILQFLHQDKESELEGSVNALADIFEQYGFNSENELWKSGKLTVVTTIKAKAEINIIFYRKEIGNALNGQKMLHGNRAANKLRASLEKALKYYQLSVYLFAYASFMEVVLGGNYSKDYLEHITEKLRKYDYQYKEDYSASYGQLEGYMKDTVETVALSGIGKVGTMAGKALARVPVLSKGPVDEALIAAGQKLSGISSDYTETAMRDFSDHRDAGIQLFIRNIDAINELSNRPVELLFDKKDVFICT